MIWYIVIFLLGFVLGRYSIIIKDVIKLIKEAKNGFKNVE